MFTKEGDDAEDIKEKLKDYESAGLLEKNAKMAVKKLAKIESQEQADLLKYQEQARVNREKQVTEYWDGVKNYIKTTSDIDGLPIEDSKKDAFIAHMTVRGKDGLTNYERNIKDQKKALKAAYTDFLGYDFSSIKRTTKTEVVKDVKKSLSRMTNTASTIASKSKQTDAEKEENKNKANKIDSKGFNLNL